MLRFSTAAVGAFAVLAMLPVSAGAAGPQSKDQQKCINDIDKRAGGVAKTQNKESAACMKNAIAGKTSSLGNLPQAQTAQACLTNDVKGKVAKADAKVSSSDASRCLSAPEQLPGFAYTGAANASAVSVSEPIGLIADIYGADLDLVTTGFAYPDDDAKDCQQAVMKEGTKFFNTLLKTANKDVKSSLKGGKVLAAASGGQVHGAGLGGIVADVKGKIAKASGKMADKVVAACAPTAATMASLFPGSCSGEATPAGVASCADTVIRCRFCQTFTATGGFSNGCDQFDDGALNASCSGSFAAARVITVAGDLITGPLAHGQLGDYLLENADARFIVQDVAKRDMYSVGGFGGNLIDMELVGSPGLDNFLEIQPSVNSETVINAQTAEIVNDGSNGGPAIVRTCGPDDILDFVNPSTVVEDAGIPFPAQANDRDSAVEGCTDYVLEPGSTALQMVTTIFNIGGVTEKLIAGDFLNAAGEVELWGSGTAGIGEQLIANLGVMSFIGYGEAGGVDYSHVTILDPDFGFDSSFFATSGVSFVLHSQSLVGLLLGAESQFEVLPGESRSFERYMGVGDGSGANAIDLENMVRGITSGDISGCVTVGGAPAPGARVSIGEQGGGTFTSVASNWTTDAAGCYSGTVAEGSYGVAGWREGTPYEGGGLTPTIHPVVIADGVPVVQDIVLPATASLSVTVVDDSLSPVPARVNVVGLDPSPELTLTTGVLAPDLTGVFRDQNDIIPFGLNRAVYTDAAGTVTLDVEPGSYRVYVSRGTEWSVFEAPVTLTAGVTTPVAATIARVLDTTGYISADYHVHGIASADSRVSDSDRVRQYAGEGVDNIIMTDHHVHTDLDPLISSLGFGSFVNSTVGEEVTTWDTGHYNAYPFTVDPTKPSGGSSDWGQAAPPGEDFGIPFGNYIAKPSEVEAIILGNPTATPDTVIQINHIDSHFVPLEIDTSLVPPASGLSTLEKKAFRLEPVNGNLFHHFTALEVWNGDDRGHQSEFLDDRIGIWMNLLNQGLLTTAIADTDTHRFQDLRAAGARTWTPSFTDDPSLILDSELASAVLIGQAIGGQGVFVETRLVANENPLIVADHSFGGTPVITIASAALGVDLEIDVQAPIWAEFDTIEIYANASTIASPAQPLVPELFSATPTSVLTAGIDFTITTTNVVPAVPGAMKLETSVSIPFTSLPEDTWFVVVVKGTDGVSEPMFPVYPEDLDTGTNTSLLDLTDGNLGEDGVMALGFTNALYVDADGTPGFQGPLEP